MFEGLTREKQREFEVARGWKPTYSALTYCTAEAIVFRRTKEGEESGSVLDYEILDAERVTGAPDCVGKRQGKWGTYVKPTDTNAEFAMKRGIQEYFGWDLPAGTLDHKLTFAGIIGPRLYKATAERTYVDGFSMEEAIGLTVTDEQAEQTPFQAILFGADVTGLELTDAGNYMKSTKDARWITIRKLIEEQGKNKDYLFWTMIAKCVRNIGYPYYPGGIDGYVFQVLEPGREYGFSAVIKSRNSLP